MEAQGVPADTFENNFTNISVSDFARTLEAPYVFLEAIVPDIVTGRQVFPH